MIYTLLLPLMGAMAGCSEDKLDPKSVIAEPAARDSDFDKYLSREFVGPYNVDLRYLFNDHDSYQSYMLTPARIASAKVMAVLIKHMWFDAYNEASAMGIDFMRENVTHEIQLVGSRMYDSSGDYVGMAVYGKKMILFGINELDPADPTTYEPAAMLQRAGRIQNIHHEFSHIMEQNKNLPPTFEAVSASDYVGDGGWGGLTQQAALDLGFVVNYAAKSVEEDYAELFGMYITRTAEDWEALIAPANSYGRGKIEEKLALVRGYMQSNWSLDMDEMRAIVLRRASQVGELEFVDLK